MLAHVFFNLPLATRLILQGWLSIPAERFRLAASLGFTAADIARTLERPMLRAVLPGAFLVIFLICTTSFAVALALGGGPRGTTVELAIYQAFRFDFDLGKAALLSLIQVAICGVAAVLVSQVALPSGFGGGLDRIVSRMDARGTGIRALDTVIIAGAAAFLLLPMAAIVVDGVAGLALLPSSVLQATIRSLLVALSSAGLTIALALSMALLAQHSRRPASSLVDGIAALSITVSPLVIGTGLFILVFPVADPVALALPITALVNAIMSLPFAYRALRPSLSDIDAVYGSLSSSLGLTGARAFADRDLATTGATAGVFGGAGGGFVDGRSWGDCPVRRSRSGHPADAAVSPDGRLPYARGGRGRAVAVDAQPCIVLAV